MQDSVDVQSEVCFSASHKSIIVHVCIIFERSLIFPTPFI